MTGKVSGQEKKKYVLRVYEMKIADDFDNQPVYQFFFARLLGSMFSRLNNQ